MRTRDRDDQRQQPSRPAAEGAAAGGGDDLRRRADRLLSVGNETIRRALSGDSERYLADVPQQGGQ